MSYEEEFSRIFRTHYLGHGEDTPLSAEDRVSIADNMTNRLGIFSNHVMPWMAGVLGDNFGTVVEVGSGCGSSTEAISPFVQSVICYEIDARAIPVFEYRMAEKGYDNHVLHQRTFGRDEGERLAGTVDGVFLPAVLEHTYFHECTEILDAAWTALRPGGWLCVVDTPNRLTPFDHHTSNLPFFSTLPMEVKLAYAHMSPRESFAGSFPAGTEPTDGMVEAMTRWGSGISYHEFELCLGRDVHARIIADGYERAIDSLLGTLPEDVALELQLKMFAPHVHRAFSRRALHLIIRKPD